MSLSEKNFIQNGGSLISYPFWVGLIVLIALAWGTSHWLEHLVKEKGSKRPFLEVTNRDFSIFLWQFPSFMRVNVAKKTGYLPGFLFDRENFNPKVAEEFVSAPPDLLFLYHTWHRLLGSEWSKRPISPSEFQEFLEQLPEWEPKNWSHASEAYRELIGSQKFLVAADLQLLDETSLPRIVRQAFQGWKNYFKEGPAINELRPSVALVETFLKQQPHYARPYWRNIDEVYRQKVAGAVYLKETLNVEKSNAILPNEQLAPFLKVALYNFIKLQDN